MFIRWFRKNSFIKIETIKSDSYNTAPVLCETIHKSVRSPVRASAKGTLPYGFKISGLRSGLGLHSRRIALFRLSRSNQGLASTSSGNSRINAPSIRFYGHGRGPGPGLSGSPLGIGEFLIKRIVGREPFTGSPRRVLHIRGAPRPFRVNWLAAIIRVNFNIVQ